MKNDWGVRNVRKPKLGEFFLTFEFAVRRRGVWFGHG